MTKTNLSSLTISVASVLLSVVACSSEEDASTDQATGSGGSTMPGDDDDDLATGGETGGDDDDDLATGGSPPDMYMVGGAGGAGAETGMSETCEAGYDGATCSNNIDDCLSNPCVNGGTCTDGVNDFTCECPAGYDGVTCSNDPDECATSPCVNGGACTDLVDDFSCACVAGYDGPTCSNDIDDCSGDPCLNGGSCTDGVDSFTCDCAGGFDGDTCDNNIDDCAGDPCLNGGICNDGVQEYTCSCPPGYLGATCDTLAVDCEDLLARASETAHGVYWIDADGDGSTAPFQVHCDMETAGGPWTLVIDQETATLGYLTPEVWRAGVTTTAPNGGQWSVLQHLGLFEGVAGYTFLLAYGDNQEHYVHWGQGESPLTGRGPITILGQSDETQTGYNSDPFFGLGADSPWAALDGEVGNPWYWAIGTNNAFTDNGISGIPAWREIPIQTRARLYVKRRQTAALCGTAGERNTVNLTCPATSVITSVDFASYGRPDGSCDDGWTIDAAEPSCHSTESLGEVEDLCRGNESCSIAVSNGLFGDPCRGATKRLSVEVTCGTPGEPEQTN